jgi:hypothetical protein
MLTDTVNSHGCVGPSLSFKIVSKFKHQTQTRLSKKHSSTYGGSSILPQPPLPKGVPQGQTENGGIALAAYAGPRAPRGGVTRKRHCTYRPSVIY